MAYTDKELLDMLRELADETGETPTSKQCDEAVRTPTSSTYLNHFNSWNDALRTAGFGVNEKKSLSEDELTSRLVTFANRIGETPTQKQLDNEPELPSARVYANRFGSWNASVEAAGLDVNEKNLSEDELRSSLQELAAELGHTPSKTELRTREQLPSATTYATRFGSWNDALRAAGLPLNHERERYDGTEQGLLDMLRDFAAEQDTSPTVGDVNVAPDLPSADVFRRRFGGWSAAKRKAGLEITEHQNHYSETELISELTRVSQELDREPTRAEMKNADAPSPSTYARRFDSWNEAKREAGLETTQETPAQ